MITFLKKRLYQALHTKINNMKIKLLFVYSLLLGLTSCGSDGLRQAFIKPNIKFLYQNTVGHGDTLSNVHYVMLSSYDDKNFNEYDFVYLADQYLDTVKHNLPVQAIHFCEPFDFGDRSKLSEDDERKMLLEHSVVEIWYDGSGFKGALPAIVSLSIWTDGKRKDFNSIDISSRRQTVNHITQKN